MQINMCPTLNERQENRIMNKPSHWMEVGSSISVWLPIAKCNWENAVIPLISQTSHIELYKYNWKQSIIVWKNVHVFEILDQ